MSVIGIVCYDDGCRLRRYARNPIRSNLSIAANKLASLNIVIDKLHFAGHTDSWCHENCNPCEVDDLKKVDTEICEQTFSWLSRYGRMTRYMDKHHYLFYILYICDFHNRRLPRISKSD